MCTRAATLVISDTMPKICAMHPYHVYNAKLHCPSLRTIVSFHLGWIRLTKCAYNIGRTIGSNHGGKHWGGMMSRIGATNAFTPCKALRQCPQSETMFDWQWWLMRYMYPVRQIVVSERYLPIVVNKRGRCGMASTRYMCKGCGCYLHPECFADYHEMEP